MFNSLVFQTEAALTETNSLIDKFTLVKYYGLRQKMICILTSGTQAFMSALANNGQATFMAWIKGNMAHNDDLSDYNDSVKKLMIAQNLNYDFEQITIPDLTKGQYTVTLSHAMLRVFSSY